MTDAIRKFETGATRTADAGRDDPEGYLSPLVIDRYNEYMTKHRKQADGTLRDSDNWQKGLPLSTYIKGAWRHFLHLWTRHRGLPVRDPLATEGIEEDLCALLFNAQGYLHETIKARLAKDKPAYSPTEKVFGRRTGASRWLESARAYMPEMTTSLDTRIIQRRHHDDLNARNARAGVGARSLIERRCSK